jgi:hypothetical protein
LSERPRLLSGRGLLEVVAIVGSILLAFAIDAAWESAQEGRLAQEALVSLRAEFEAERAEVARHGARWREVGLATARLLEALGEDQAPSPAVADTLIMRFMTPTTFDAAEGTLSALISSGDIDLIGDRELRNGLSAWAGIVRELNDNEIAMREFLLMVMAPFLASQEVSIGRTNAVFIGQFGLEWPASLPSDEEAAATYERLFRDEEFEALVSTRYTWINDAEYARAVEFADGLLAGIDAELAQR